ncbi:MULTISPECIES: anti-sigma factor domain-containing protein [Streptomyces]|nr:MULTISPECIES: anti-sigma factor [Streptomyces]KJY16237.1 anti-sigma-K factor RskA [Streptomyces sp. NRRL S-104]KOU30799.1 anti-sigma-K factor RskA [Streptomyces sp. WM6373]KOU69614.1 anti-sigma-K factor RskA [Streptomyces sp. XY66]KOU70428.1 anti-sigma-K factor RskA [Streptomyces sp. IGB124]KOU93814.1 anti-sigma-K factor RskA [Streptomyces sp. XY58]
MKQHHSDVHTLAAAYALNALEPAERKAFTEHLPQCQACREEVAEFEATAARLADATAQYPPAAMKHHVMAAVDGVRQLPPRVPDTAPTATLGSALRRRAVPLALAASVVAAASFAGLAAWQNQQSEQYQQRATQAEQRLDDVSTVLAAPDARTAHGRASNGAATTVVASERQNRAVFTASGLPAPAPGKTYQLWLDHDGTMRPAGFIRQDGTVLIDGDTADAGAVGLTIEPAGGSRRPTSAPLLLMALPT